MLTLITELLHIFCLHFHFWWTTVSNLHLWVIKITHHTSLGFCTVVNIFLKRVYKFSSFLGYRRVTNTSISSLQTPTKWKFFNLVCLIRNTYAFVITNMIMHAQDSFNQIEAKFHPVHQKVMADCFVWVYKRQKNWQFINVTLWTIVVQFPNNFWSLFAFIDRNVYKSMSCLVTSHLSSCYF